KLQTIPEQDEDLVVLYEEYMKESAAIKKSTQLNKGLQKEIETLKKELLKSEKAIAKHESVYTWSLWKQMKHIIAKKRKQKRDK
ncbi:MAG: hypothetical protein ACRCWQ_03990, partial [Bacilli bacterium]